MKLLTIDEVADRLSDTPDSVRRYIRQRRMSAVSITRKKVRVSEAEVERFITRNTVKGEI
jgi:excisionase family DNA binding protein